MRSRARTVAAIAFGVVALLGAGAGYAAYEYNRQQDMKEEVGALTGGDPDQAPALMARYGCSACHTIPGVRGARGRVGPQLQQFASRVYIGGVITNRPDHLVRWIVNPRALSPKTAMPVTGISEAEARHVAAYLLTLR
jgi:cytochrome c2